VHLTQGNSAQLLERVVESSLDIAILPMVEARPGVDTIILSREPVVAVCPLRHPLAGRRIVALGDLAGESFVDFEQGWAVRQLIDRAFEAAGVPRQTAFEVSDVATMLALVERGLGIALVPRAVGRRPTLAMVPLAEPKIIWELAAVYQATGNAAKAAPRAFLDMLARQVR
jgi:DNA-binding transcriptional LysR family regulator